MCCKINVKQLDTACNIRQCVNSLDFLRVSIGYVPRFKFAFLSAAATVSLTWVTFVTDCDVAGTTKQLHTMALISNSVAHGRIKKVSRPRAPFVDGATLQPILVDIPICDLSSSNVTQASDVSLLRARAKDIRMRFQRLALILFGGGVDRCKWKSPEGDGCAGSRVSNLLRYIDWHLPKIRLFTTKIRASEKFNFELQQADRGRGELNWLMKQKGDAIARELSNRNVEHWSSETPVDVKGTSANENAMLANNSGGALAHINNGARARNEDSASAPIPSFPEIYREQVLRVERLQREEELGIKAPTTEEIRTYNRTKAYFERNYDAVMDIDKSREFRSNIRSGKRRRAKERKRGLQAYIAKAYGAPDPSSDHDGTVANAN